MSKRTAAGSVGGGAIAGAGGWSPEASAVAPSADASVPATNQRPAGGRRGRGERATTTSAGGAAPGRNRGAVRAYCPITMNPVIVLIARPANASRYFGKSSRTSTGKTSAMRRVMSYSSPLTTGSITKT